MAIQTKTRAQGRKARMDPHRSKEARFRAAHDGLVVDPSDDPAAVPFYRVHAGLRAAWGDRWCRDASTAVHHAACEAGWFAGGNLYAGACEALRQYAERLQPPTEPHHQYSWASCPEEPTEEDAREEFRAQFRRAFPGRRANSRFGREKWEEVKDKAMAIVRARYDAALARYEENEARIRAFNTAQDAAYRSQRDAYERFQRDVAELTE